MIYVPAVPERLSPVVKVVLTQLFAYNTAATRGRDIGEPRNVAESITVE